MADERLDDLIPILDVTSVCGFPHGRRTPKRWARDGVRDRGGNVVRLGTMRIGGRLFSTRRHVAEFLAAIQTGGGVSKAEDAVGTARDGSR